MNPLSVVIITLNEEHNIVDCIRCAKLISDDIVVVDTGSQDSTVSLAVKSGAEVFSIKWEGYGASRNFGASKAKHNWILALDADERISEKLALTIHQLELSDCNCIYRFHRKNFLGQEKIQFGTPGFETVKRIYNRSYAKWDLTLVHEKLMCTRPVKKKITGHIDHYGSRNETDYKAKAVLYAQMSAEKYFIQGKRTNWLKRYSSPLFNSAKSYLFQLGFLDGKQGWVVARTIAWYSWLKYFYLHQLWKEAKTKEISFATEAR
ncbi:MAG TPA: glycosyltransferase family 2 protein [Flavisolibacter sp.]|nr:glycosyltransferase family 2 protein [Flavisolibacter sp.]